ncbi:hypothetical protein [Tessaracoccus sp. ZS01]|uniref:hypothetical protein n=1 Tax=Tessaracoccus sp. ZS01 TaxID=1906324 RepID=UPI00096FAC56|nr:hypothetical protein [Tessaracoccus sp. ZS01]MCG6567664.1 hypothetical protein [Tessaracoccus sp. ZS01]OMG55737.1 hypothetical protein BJN44_08530 [Tessaracoccus sp. ZS01]
MMVETAVEVMAPAEPAGGGARSLLGTIWAGARATVGALMGLAPHVLHHVGFLAGAAILTGFLGNAVLYVAGLLLSIPLLRRIHRRFATWKAPAIGVVIFSTLFLFSTLVLGPLFNPDPGSGDEPDAPAPAATPAEEEHDGHHE